MPDLRTTLRNRRGFTMIEMMVVIVILAMAAALVLPRLPSTDAAKLTDSGRNLAALIRYLGDKSITTKTSYRFRIDIGQNTIAVRKMIDGQESEESDPFFSRLVLMEGIFIEDVQVASLGKTDTGEITVGFGPGGLDEFMIIHLKGNKDRHVTVTAQPRNGRVRTEEGYQEVTKQ